MVNYALSVTTGQALVSGLNAEFMRDLPQRIAESSYLSPDLKGALLDRYARTPSWQLMRDALALGIVGSELADESNDELSAVGGRLWGPARLFAEAPSYYTPLTLRELVRQIADSIRNGNPSSAVLELNQMQRSPTKLPIEKVLTSLFREPLGTRSARLYAGRIRSGLFRLPSLSLLESSLRYIYGDRAPSLCHATYDIGESDLNKLHEIDYRMIGLVFEALFFDGRKKKESPLEFLFHDIGHILDYVQRTPFTRRISAQYLRILEHHLKGVPTAVYSRSAHEANTNVTLNLWRSLVLDVSSDLESMSDEIFRVFNPEYAQAIAHDLMAHLEYDRDHHPHSESETVEYEAVMGLLEEGLDRIEAIQAA